MGVQLKLEDIDAMQEDHEDSLPLSDIKTGYTPTATVTSGEIVRDFSQYENLDTPTPIKTSDLLAYTRFDPHFLAPTDTRPSAQRQFFREFPLTQETIRGAYGISEPPGCELDNQMHHNHVQYPRASNYHTIDKINLNPINPYCFQCSHSISLANKLTSSHSSPSSHPFLPTSTTDAMHSPPLITRPGTYESDHFAGIVNRRCISVPQTLSCFNTSQCTDTFVRATVKQVPLLDYAVTKVDPVGCLLVDNPRPRRSRPTGRPPRRSSPTVLVTSALETIAREKLYACSMGVCGKRFARIDELKRHQRTHSNIRPYTCNMCDKGFTRSDHLITHRRTHTGEKPYPCHFCERCFARSDERSRHEKTHTTPRFNSRSSRGRKSSGKPLSPLEQVTPSLLHREPFLETNLNGAVNDISYHRTEVHRLHTSPPPPHKPQ